jgi:hypothetical protein
MSASKITLIALASVLSLTLAGCSAPVEEDIQNSVVVEGGETNADGTQNGGASDGNNGSTDGSNSNGNNTGGSAGQPTAKPIETVAELNLTNPQAGADAKAELDRIALQSISALLAFGIYEEFEDPNTNTRFTYAFDPSQTGNQLSIKIEYLDGSKEDSITTGNRTAWLTPHLALIVSSDDDATVVLKGDYLEADLAGKGVYKYYFTDGVITRLEAQITGQDKAFSGTIEYVSDKRVKDLVALVN